MVTPSVYPSGFALATAAVPTLPPAPGLFSTMNGWPSRLPSWSVTSRATTSGVEPGPNGTTTFTVMAGQAASWAWTGAMPSIETATAASSDGRRTATRRHAGRLTEGAAANGSAADGPAARDLKGASAGDSRFIM